MATRTQPSVADDLNAAADYIQEHGWCQGTLFDTKGQVCLTGAVGFATGALRLTPGKGSWFNYEWTRIKTRQKRYNAALLALAKTLDPEWAERAMRVSKEEINELITELVVATNDSEHAETWTKRKVVGILRRAAKKAAAGQ